MEPSPLKINKKLLYPLAVIFSAGVLLGFSAIIMLLAGPFTDIGFWETTMVLSVGDLLRRGLKLFVNGPLKRWALYLEAKAAVSNLHVHYDERDLD